VLTHRLNDSIRVLTAFSVILLPLTLIASIFGMNVSLPFVGDAGDSVGFWVIIAVMAVMLVAMAVYFRRRGFL
jgi:magnesium transporter